MRNRLDNILLGLLWLLAATLGTSFWFNTIYGFNIFSAPHWQYLAYLQASKAPVAPSFYISLGICVFITIFGLYFLIQPKFRKIVFPIKETKQTKTAQEQKNAEPNTTPDAIQSDAAEIIIPAATTQNTLQAQSTDTQTPVPAPAPAAHPAPLRPPRLTLPAVNS